MEIDFVVGTASPDFNVIRNEQRKVIRVELDYRLTLLQIHCLSRKLLSPEEFAVYGLIMMPKPVCTHMGEDYKPTVGYISEIEPQIT